MWDYVVIGAGSAGCVLARRLSEDAGARVLVIEAGGPDPAWDYRIHMPAALSMPLASDTYNWCYRSEPEPGMDGRRMYCPRGRVLGGSSSINGMVYVRGNPLDYDGWAETRGLEGWSYRRCLPYFRRAEARDVGADDYHGGDGPLAVTTARWRNPLYPAFVAAGVEAGYARVDDLNGYRQEGFGPLDRTTRGGRRASAARAYLHPVRGRANLVVETRALARRVVLDGRRAIAVEVERAGAVEVERAEREVIVCAGAINSPALLQVSGIGAADDLRALGIAVLADVPGVGAGLEDHLEVYVQHACRRPVTLYPALAWWRRPAIGAAWLLRGRGVGASNHFEAGGFVRTRDEVPFPNLQYHFVPVAMHYDGRHALAGHGYQAHVGPMRPTSRGTVSVRSPDPRTPPRIRFEYLATADDRREMREAVRITREILAQPALAEYRGAELAPGSGVASDADVDAWVRANAESAYHPACTCRMGADDDPLAVVDAEGRVRGVEALRVVDASIMPRIVTGNLNAPTIMIAEKIADAIRGREPLPAAAVAYHVARGAPARATR